MTSPLASMTGFGRAGLQAENCAILVEIKSVNGRGLDIRARLPNGFDALDAQIRRIIGDELARGSVSVFLNVQRQTAGARLVVNEAALEQVLGVVGSLRERIRAQKPSIEAILALKGIMEVEEASLAPEAEQRLHTAILNCVTEACAALSRSRQVEGTAIGAVLAARIDEIESLAEAAGAHPARAREVILARLDGQVRALLETDRGLSEDRLVQEALILATKADIAEELDRLKAHVAAARALLARGGPIGRKFDFLSQEFNREANTLCSKSNDVGLTAIGLDLKAAIDQLREQVQNLE